LCILCTAVPTYQKNLTLFYIPPSFRILLSIFTILITEQYWNTCLCLIKYIFFWTENPIIYLGTYINSITQLFLYSTYIYILQYYIDVNGVCLVYIFMLSTAGSIYVLIKIYVRKDCAALQEENTRLFIMFFNYIYLPTCRDSRLKSYTHLANQHEK